MWFACNPDGSGYAAPKICDDGKACTVDSCAPASGCANVAQPGVDCSEPAKCAVDSKTDGQETDVDCGGAVCPHCASGAKCLVALDCLSQSCLSGVCSGDPGCVDGKKSGNETDTDCGGQCACYSISAMVTSSLVRSSLPLFRDRVGNTTYSEAQHDAP